MKSLKHSGRRAFLQVAGGAVVALPMLEYTHGHAWANGDYPRRFVAVFSHGGTISNMGGTDRYLRDGENSHGQNWFFPSGDPGQLSLAGDHGGNSILDVPDLRAVEDKLLVLEGIDLKAGQKASTVYSNHARGGHYYSNVAALTAADATSRPPPGQERDKYLYSAAGGPSIDTVIGQRLQARLPVPFRRLHLKVEGSNWNDHYTSPFYTGRNQIARGIQTPREAWDQVFQGVGATDAGPDRHTLSRRWLFDGGDRLLTRFREQVSARDRDVVDAHLEHLHALQTRLDSLPSSVACQVPARPPALRRGGLGGGVSDTEAIGELHADLLVAALRCGLTNVGCLEIADLITPFTPAGRLMGQDIGHGFGHLARTIRGEDRTNWLREARDNRRWRVGLFARVAKGLDEIPEGEGTMLDNAAMLYTSEMSNASTHTCVNVPVLLAGSGGGHLRTGRYLNYNQASAAGTYWSRESHHNLFVSLLHAMGESDARFGNDAAEHEGPLPNLT